MRFAGESNLWTYSNLNKTNTRRAVRIMAGWFTYKCTSLGKSGYKLCFTTSLCTHINPLHSASIRRSLVKGSLTHWLKTRLIPSSECSFVPVFLFLEYISSLDTSGRRTFMLIVKKSLLSLTSTVVNTRLCLTVCHRIKTNYRCDMAAIYMTSLPNSLR